MKVSVKIVNLKVRSQAQGGRGRQARRGNSANRNQGASQRRSRNNDQRDRRSNSQQFEFESSSQESTRELVNFRNMTIYPESEDILCSDETIHLRPNLTEEKYSDVEQYLDIQFRLLREDYIRPLRSSIAEYRQKRFLESQQQTVAVINANDPPPEVMRYTSPRIYENVKFIKGNVKENTQDSRRKKNNNMLDSALVCFASKKDKKFKNMDWEHNQRFMHGSLLCFSSDNFQTLVFGTVLERDVKLLEQGKIRITLCEAQQQTSYQDEYTMVESEVFFTPYFYVLKTLQMMTMETYPFPEYFLYLEKNDNPPKYLTTARTHWNPVRYTLMQVSGFNLEMNVLDKYTWPSAQKLGLHNVQYDALQAALTKELVVIQGPPGTGKTFIGLKIAEILVGNKAAASRTTPILVIALTNHALDQFLVGMLKFTDEIIRIGGQSKCPELSTYNLKNKRSRVQSNEVRNLWKEVRQLESQMEWYHLKITNLQSIVSQGFIDPDTRDDRANNILPSQFISDLMNGEFMSWLLQIENSHDLEIQGNYHSMSFNELLQEINRNVSRHVSTYRIKLEGRTGNFNTNSMFILQNFIAYLKIQLRNTRTSMEETKTRAFDLQDLEVLRHCDVVGMTTTSGARQQTLLRMLNPEIVIIEEAAEVMEAHIIACITNKCQHLILIGDHKQLRPKVSSFELESFNFHVSLFERMIMTRGKYVTLTEQHRMAPQISQLVTPSIYNTLTNAQKVVAYPEIEDSSSRKNKHEASFLLSLCDHLIKQGYKPSQITILSTYKGQMQHIRKVVDNYQGEENDIILLSLVRSNKRNEIGFLKTENRVCVALTRAKLGMFIIGNMTCLSTSALWRKMKSTLQSQGALGPGLPLRCRLHPTKISIVATSSDFQEKSPYGGCILQCGYTLPCLHTCTRTCHPMDQDHRDYKCQSPCENICPYNHPCQKLCFEICGDCTVQVPKVRSCSHDYLLECSVDVERIRCMKPCPKNLPCLQHPCPRKCCENCEPCAVLVDKTRSCGHTSKWKCSEDPEEFNCLTPCTFMLGCGHPCQRKCWETCEPCEVNVLKTRNCGHTHVMFCSTDIDDVFCSQNCSKILTCGHKCERMCSESCYPCGTPVSREKSCGHIFDMTCGTSRETLERMTCRSQCTKILDCNHACKKKCWEECQPCMEIVWKKATCGHDIQVACSIQTPRRKLCPKPCVVELSCGHRCANTCNKPCTEKCVVEIPSGRECGHTAEFECWEIQKASVASFFVRVFSKDTFNFKPFEELATSVTQVRECLTDSRQKHDITNVKIMETSVCILSHICKVWNTCCRVNPDKTSINELKSYATFLLYLLRKEKIGNLWHINEQRVADFTLELERLQKMAQYFCLMSLVGPTEGLQPQYVTLIKRLCLLVFSFKQRFTAEKISESAELFRQVYMLLKIEKPVDMQFGNVYL
ncbi:hypothetical protein B566_EDAN011898 [Ephemera danica]|nr:hypothetical protein B566_EDAN011898 [Ephemera danica]